MKNVLDWIKGHAAIVVLCAVIVLILPIAYVGASVWNKRIRESRQMAVETRDRELRSLAITYTAGPGTELARPAPNAEITAWYKDQRRRLESQVSQVIIAAQKLNRNRHAVLVEGLFPEPSGPEAEAQLKRIEFAERLVGRPNSPSAYQTLLDSINAGGPADAADLAAALDELRSREIERFRAERGDEEPSQEETEQLTEKLVGARIGEYQRRASEVTVYATLASLPQNIPSQATPAPDLLRCFEHQWDYWVVSDLVRAIAAANRGADGGTLPVERAPVKRIVRVQIDRLPIYNDNMIPESPATPTVMSPGQVPLDYAVSLTGRHSSRANQLYDVRLAELTVVVSSSRLPELVRAICQTNLMAVIGCSIEEVDPWAELELGYYYGPEHIVRATLKVETVWLRSWVAPLMPARVKSLMFVEGADAPVGDQGGDDESGRGPAGPR